MSIHKKDTLLGAMVSALPAPPTVRHKFVLSINLSNRNGGRKRVRVCLIKERQRTLTCISIPGISFLIIFRNACTNKVTLVLYYIHIESEPEIGIIFYWRKYPYPLLSRNQNCVNINKTRLHCVCTFDIIHKSEFLLCVIRWGFFLKRTGLFVVYSTTQNVDTIFILFCVCVCSFCLSLSCAFVGGGGGSTGNQPARMKTEPET